MTERMTAAELNAMTANPKGKQRAGGDNAKSVLVDGIRFDSKHEAKRWAVLQWRVKLGEIVNLRRQFKIDLIGKNGPILTLTGRVMHYKADFVYNMADTGVEVIEDAKGHASDIYLMKKAILAAQGIDVIEV